MRPRRSAARSRSSAAFAAALCAAALTGCGETDCDEFAFDGEKWNDPQKQGDREDQAHGLIDCGWLVGKTRRQIRDGLGKPDLRDRREWDYIIGTSDGSDSAFLSIAFDASGRVRSAEIPQ